MSGAALKALIANGALSQTVVPGAFDPLCALLAERAGFPTIYLSGASVNYTRFGRPDIGFAGLSDVEDTVRRITSRCSLPLIVDADTGFGGVVQAADTVRRLEAAGAAAIQIEDQDFPKRCGHLPGKQLVALDEMLAKIKVATDARNSDDTLIIARTDAIAVDGLDAAIERGHAFLEAGADALFIEAPKTGNDLELIGKTFGDKTSLIANLVDGGKTPLVTRNMLADFDIVLVPGAPVRAMVRALQHFYGGLHQSGDIKSLLPILTGFDELNHILGLEDELAR